MVAALLLTTALSGCLAAERQDAPRYSWETPQAKVLPEGRLEWAPQPFAYAPVGTVRHIDFVEGDDANPGTREAPWRHHPWDPAASGQAKAAAPADTYVFRGGVAYRGVLRMPREAALRPVLLTRDPAWGDGEAVITGSVPAPAAWQRADVKLAPRIPEPEKVWHQEIVGWTPRCLWLTADDGSVVRLPLARTPNWRVSNPDDIKAEWWTWDNPDWWRDGGHKTTGKGGKKVHLGIDKRRLATATAGDDYLEPAPAAAADSLVGGVVWSEWGIVMGTPFAAEIETHDPVLGHIGFQGVWYGDSGQVIRNNRYYLENLPQFLDEPGEWYFAPSGKDRGRLFLRLPGDADPNAARIEIGRETTLVELAPGAADVRIVGLAFHFTNVWHLPDRAFVHPEVAGACVRLHGSAGRIEVANCRFGHINRAVRIKAVGDEDRVAAVVVRDCDIAFTDHGAIDLENGSRWAKTDPPIGTLGDVHVMRNRLHMIGMRPVRSEHGHAVTVSFPETAEVAGNLLDRCYGAGLFIFGGKGSGELREAPFCRLLIHHNQVVDPLLNTNDWGGIETWQGGPAYVYNNVSGNPGGYWHWAFSPDKPGSARFGHAYYLDGAFKNHLFNNLAWGKSHDPASPLGNTAAFQEIHSYGNDFFNNTAYNFVVGSRRQAPHAGRDRFLGNLWQDIGDWTFRHADPADTAAEGNARDAGEQKEHFAGETNAYARNVFYNLPDGRFGVVDPSGRWLPTLTAFREALDRHAAHAADIGEIAAVPPLPRAAEGDFRPDPAATAGRGVKAFVPWSLHGTVGEWHFLRNSHNPAMVVDEHWQMTAYHVGREDYYTRPRFPLAVVGGDLSAYVPGLLEDWTAGALRLDGSGRHCVLAHAELSRPFHYIIKRGNANERQTVSGEALRSPDIYRSSLIVEIVFRADPGMADAILAQKLGPEAGYALSLAAGKPRFLVRAAGTETAIHGPTTGADGQWHHLLAELDRAAGTIALFLDGTEVARAPHGLAATASLANPADLLVGGGPGEPGLVGEIDFLRLAQGSLAESRTDIAELHAWQFNGPHLRDFAGRPRLSGHNDAGALLAGE
jgi:hypothetical protein